MNIPNNQFIKQPVKKKNKPPSKLIRVLIGAGTGLLTLIILISVNFPVKYIANDIISSQYTSTSVPPTSTPMPTFTQISTQTPTLTPTPLATALPTSAFQISDSEFYEPSFPEVITKGIILNDDTNVTVEPDFSNMQWSHSASIAQQLGLEFDEQFHATFGPGNVTWKMDVPVDPGIYEIYVLDTLYSSGGKLNFQVFLGDRQLKPLLGSSEIEYRTSRSDPQQKSDIWQSIGIYELDASGLVSVKTSWELRNEATIVAIDRILIGRIPDTIHTILNQLPPDKDRYLLDDSFAEFGTDQYWEIQDKTLAWGDNYHFMENPPIATDVVWTIPYNLPVGQYEVMAWIPKIRGTVNVTYSITANSTNDLANEQGEYEVTITQGDRQDPQWISIGTWTIPEVYGESVNLKLKMALTSDSAGEVVADVIAFVKN